MKDETLKGDATEGYCYTRRPNTPGRDPKAYRDDIDEEADGTEVAEGEDEDIEQDGPNGD